MSKDKQAKPLPFTGSSTVEYAERVVENDAKGEVQKVLRQYGRMDFRRKFGEQLQESSLRPETRRMVLLRHKQAEVPFSPDGPLTWGEIDRVRTDVFTPALRGLLPAHDVRAGEEWQASAQAVTELTDLDEITEGQIVCKLQEVVSRGSRRYAQVSFKGTVRGINEDGPNRQQLDGFLFFDLQSNHLSYLSMNGKSWLLDKEGKNQGSVEGTYVLTKRIDPAMKELSDESVRNVTVEPTPDKTMLLFHEPALGVRFVYPRRWTVRRADARQIILEEPAGAGLLITLEPAAKTPTAQQFQQEVADWLRKQTAKVLRGDPPRKVQSVPREVERFAFETQMEKETVLLDYYVARQAGGGATFAGRLPAKDGVALQKEVEGIARSLELGLPKK
jgi:hypothetical protein